MAKADSTTLHADLVVQNEIDRLCDEFEDSWKSGRAPDISHYLQRTAPNLWSTLLVELVRIDMEYRSGSGLAPTTREYTRRFPEYEQLLSTALADRAASRQQLDELTQIGSFRLMEKVGTGAFGVVWRAWDVELEREVAVKLPTERSLNREYEAEFQREAKSAARLKHPGIVRLIDFDTRDGISYIVYEFVDGVTLKRWVQNQGGRISPRDAARLCLQVTQALMHAHENGVVHRDLKPGNILMNSEGRPLITDFGLAKRVDSNSTAAGSGTILGTLAYMSPEQAKGESGTIDARSDVYSLGVILFELVTGNPVFQGDPKDVIRRIMFDEPPQISDLIPNVDPDLQRICSVALRKEPEDRYVSAAALASDLELFLQGRSVPERGIPKRLRLRRWLAKHLVPVSLAAVTCLLAGALGWKMFFASVNDPVKRPPFGVDPLPSFSGDSAAAERCTVEVTTNPAGVLLTAKPLDPMTGEIIPDRIFTALSPTPAILHLPPGQFLVHVSRNVESAEGPRVISNSVVRTVPGRDGSWPSLSAAWERYERLSQDEIQWPEIVLPEDVPVDFVYVPGIADFRFDTPDGPRTVAMTPMYVSSREFAFGDFQWLRPGHAGDIPGINAAEQSPEIAMPCRYDMAAHWAEQMGARLLSNLEYSYLLAIADGRVPGIPESQRPKFEELADGAVAAERESDSQAAGLPIIGLRSGLAEWTSTWPSSPYSGLPGQSEGLSVTECRTSRIIRSGDATAAATNTAAAYPHSETGEIYSLYADVGFRIVRTAVPPKVRMAQED